MSEKWKRQGINGKVLLGLYDSLAAMYSSKRCVLGGVLLTHTSLAVAADLPSRLLA